MADPIIASLALNSHDPKPEAPAARADHFAAASRAEQMGHPAHYLAWAERPHGEAVGSVSMVDQGESVIRPIVAAAF